MTLARRLLLALWAGLLVSVGALVAPTLFSILANRLVAGRIAAELFRRATFASVVLALLVCTLGWYGTPARPVFRRLAPLAPAAALLLSEFAVRPVLEVARVAQGAGSAAFIAWHAVSAALYALATLLTVVLLAEELKRTP